MATSRIPAATWVARNARMLIGDANVITFSNSTTLSGSFSSQGYQVEAALKTVTITPPETAWEKQDFLGKDSNSFQNQLLDEKPVGTATATGTMITGEDETIEDMMSGVNVSPPSGYTRRQIGVNNTSDAVLAVVISLQSVDGSNEISFAFDNAKFTKWGDVRISGPDSHFEQDFTIMCLAKDFYSEFKN